MIEKELKKLSRRELVDIIYQMKKNEQNMLDEINALKEELEDRRLRISEAGSIAEAAVVMTDLFSNAQKTADLYLQEIASLKEETEKECKEKIEEANKTAAKLYAVAEKQCEAMRRLYKLEQKKMQRLQAEVRTLEAKKNKSCEGLANEQKT